MEEDMNSQNKIKLLLVDDEIDSKRRNLNNQKY